jgi:hypothetical protein
MMDRDIFEIASEQKFLFPSIKGPNSLKVEDLWDLPLSTTRANQVDLDSVARTVNTELQSVTEVSFVNTKPDPRKAELTMKLELIKRVIARKQEQNAKNRDLADRAEKRAQLATALAAKREQSLAQLSEEEILAKLNELEAVS